jgi:hypothetical protein
MRRLVAIEQRRIGRMAAVHRRTRRPSRFRERVEKVSSALYRHMHCPLPWHWWPGRCLHVPSLLAGHCPHEGHACCRAWAMQTPAPR